MHSTLRAVALVCFLLGGAQRLFAQTVTAVPTLDRPRYTGTWYEIAHYVNKREKNCMRDTVHEVAEGDKAHSLQFVNACMTKRGYADASNVSGNPQDKKIADGRLKVGSFWPLTRKYWVLALGPEYDWSLTGNPNHKELWIFSRKTTMDPETLKTIEARADALGYSSAKLVMVPQTPR